MSTKVRGQQVLLLSTGGVDTDASGHLFTKLVAGGGISSSAAGLTLPLTTKGDILAHDGTNHFRMPVGNDGEHLESFAGSASGGLIWRPITSPTKNIVHNGGMNVCQRATAISVGAGASLYTLDRWRYGSNTGSGAVTVLQSSSVPSVAGAQHSLEIACTVAGTVAAGSASDLVQPIEGLDASVLHGQFFTISFWVNTNKTGDYTFTLRNGLANRTYLKKFNVPTSNTWTKISITAAHDVTGTWTYDTGVGWYIGVTLSAGSNFFGTDNTFQNGNLTAVSTQVNFYDSTSNVFFITGVQLEQSFYASAFENRRFAEEVFICQRYYEKSFPYATAPAQNAGNTGAYTYLPVLAATNTVGMYVPFSVRKRVPPGSITFYNPGAANAKWRNTVDNADSGTASTASIQEQGFTVQNGQQAGDGIADVIRVHWDASADL